ncbi:class I SAM-dependent methyltransferase [Leptolyngbya sp. CCNP1308]|uniref:class I SAM-dependent methyltransferase n=1 Tax=Leptolyngbya sp. CCNP1308 TaxID=3110255 RepID=UPI002B20E24F|nr:class I SAM-dependent methyltransferase [Leptolyngbya sp. CCNP1308]MEA5448418.1 class I SAM-dependent methyltransferase [Leptolyngbya sp. CCNP1308]
MSKSNEINYIKNVSSTEGIAIEQFANYLEQKPFSDPQCGNYLIDIGQMMRFLPQPPARLLDIGVGSGWTSDLFCQRGYEVLGLDISPDMIELANRRARPSLCFQVCDYEVGPLPSGFNIAVIYDALHHAEDVYKVIKNVYDALGENGILITAEPGVGHSQTEDSITVMKKYGTTEKDMPFSLQRQMMLKAGFGVVEQYARVTQLPLCEISTPKGALAQLKHAISLTYGSVTGLTSIVIARKVPANKSQQTDMKEVSAKMLSLMEDHRLKI